MNEDTKGKPQWWPKNPCPIWHMTEKKYCEIIPDAHVRIQCSVYISRLAWELASGQIFEAWEDSKRCNCERCAPETSVEQFYKD